MSQPSDAISFLNPGRLFFGGLGLVMLALWLPFVPAWPTLIHGWQVPLFASVFFLLTLLFLFKRTGKNQIRFSYSSDELKFVLLPIIALIVWSALSALWAPSWKSAIRYSALWCVFLIFYCIARYLVDHGQNYSRVLKFFVATLILVAVPAVFEYCAFLVFGGTTTIGVRFAKWGEQVVTLLPLVLVAVVRFRGTKFTIGVAALAAMWLLVFCSLGRINIILFICGIASIAILIFTFKRFHRYRLNFAIITVVLLLAPLPVHVFTLFAETPDVPLVSRLRNDESISSSNDFRRMAISVSMEMIADNPLLGVGGDNYGMQFNRYRETYGTRSPDDANLANAESRIPAHAHNEFIQVVAELGFVGGAILAWLLVGIALMAYRAVRGLSRSSLYSIAAVLGVGMFLVSSAVSSYSFRVPQNAFVFFFVLAVAARLLLSKPGTDPGKGDVVSRAHLKLGFATGMIACVSLGIYSASSVGSVMITNWANATGDLSEASEIYRLASKLDDENARAYQNHGMRLFREERYAQAVPYLRKSIDLGLGTSTDFSYLASAQALSGDNAAAEASIRQASRLYPQSAFVLTRYSVLLKENGKDDAAGAMFDRALKINAYDAKTWLAVITEGPKVASDKAARSDDRAKVMELQPNGSIYAVVAERFIRFPDERKYSALR